ncbi:unnamed protein product [Musa hybrid cultivar]
MGEAQQEEAKADPKPEVDDKKEVKKEKQEEIKKEEVDEKKAAEAKPSPPSPIVLSLDLHCVGCARKIEKLILKCRGVEGVEMDMVQNQVTVKGVVDPQVVCSRIQKRTLRRAKVLAPLPPAEGDYKPDAVPPQVSEMTTVELLVNMHCEACAQQLRRKILKMRGVQTVETDFGAGKITVTGTMKAETLVEHIHRRTLKFASIVSQPPKEEEKKQEDQKKAEEKPAEEKKEESREKKEEQKATSEEEKPEGNKEGGDIGGGKEEKGGGEEANKEEDGGSKSITSEEDMMKRMMMYWNGGIIGGEDMAKRMVHWVPFYVIQQPLPPPQIFSDENPNACCIL